MSNRYVVSNVLGRSLACGGAPVEKCPSCGGEWFVVCTHIYYIHTVLAPQLIPDIPSDGDEDGEYAHRADEAFACVKCGTVVMQDRMGAIAIEQGKRPSTS
jgi:hypothetical protein